MQEVFYKLVRETKTRGGTIFFSSHNLAEVRRICDRVGIIRAGKLIAEKNIAELALNASHTFDLTFSGPAPIDAFKKLKKAKIVTSPDPTHITVHIMGQLAPFFSLLSSAKVTQIEQRELNLEDEFLHLYEKDGK
jgi:ABC-2 type transport system ATP-binding protein